MQCHCRGSAGLRAVRAFARATDPLTTRQHGDSESGFLEVQTFSVQYVRFLIIKRDSR